MSTKDSLIIYALQNQRKFAFFKYNAAQIVKMVAEAYDSKRIIYSSDDFGRITGIGIYDVYPAESRIHCNQLLANKLCDMKAIVRTFFHFFPANEWTLTAYRRGKQEIITYNTEKLKSKLLGYRVGKS